MLRGRQRCPARGTSILPGSVVALLLVLLVAGPTAAQQVSDGQVNAALDLLQQQLQQIRGQAQALERRSDDLEERLRQALADQGAAEREAAQARDALAQLRQELDQVKQGLAQSEEREASARDALHRAETRLTERSQEVLELQANLARAERQNQVHDRQAEDTKALRRQAIATDADLAQLEGERKVLEGRYATLERQITDLREQQRRLQNDCSAETRRALEQVAALKRALMDRDREIAALRVPPAAPDSGTVTADEATRRATAAANSLIEARRAARGQRDPALRRAERDAEKRLHEAQLLLSRAIGARTVYRVRQHDTLAAISRRFFANSGHWQEIFAANRHLLEDPNRLTPGFSLVIP